jgi:c(7)-type cytochrome triheme protein
MKRAWFLASIGIICLFSGMAFALIGGGDISFIPMNAKRVVFSHDFHVKDLGHTCQSCHPHLYITKKKDQSVTMAEMNVGKSCGACHNGNTAFTTKGHCSKCHQ